MMCPYSDRVCKLVPGTECPHGCALPEVCDIIDGVYSEAITARKTCDECAHWIGKEDYPPEYQYCDLYHICPTLDFFDFLTNLGMLGKCPCFEEERQ